jgi:hypothetical protein
MILILSDDNLLERHQQVDVCNGAVWCCLWGTDWFLKYYKDELRLQRVNLNNYGVSEMKICNAWRVISWFLLTKCCSDKQDSWWHKMFAHFFLLLTPSATNLVRRSSSVACRNDGMLPHQKGGKFFVTDVPAARLWLRWIGRGCTVVTVK